MNKFPIIVFLLLLLLITIGCTGNSTVIQKVNSKSLDLQFGYKPAEVYDKEGLELAINYRNLGSQDINDGRFFVTGFDQQFIQPTTDGMDFVQGKSFQIDGVTDRNPSPITQTIIFTDSSVNMPPNADKFNQIFKVTACYSYRTRVEAQVCIDTAYKSTKPKACNFKTVTVTTQNGGPVQVSRIEEQMFQDRAQYKIYFRNTDSLKDIIDTTNMGNCPFKLNELQDLNKVHVIAPKVSTDPIECTPANPVTIFNNQGYLLCTYYFRNTNMPADAYLTTLTFDLEYGIRQSLSTNINILRG